MLKKRESGYIAYIVLVIIFLLIVLIGWLSLRLYSRYSSTFNDYFQVFLSSFESNNSSTGTTYVPPIQRTNSSSSATSSASVQKVTSSSAPETQNTSSSNQPQTTPVRQAAPVPRSEPPTIAKTYTRSELNSGYITVPVFKIYIEGKQRVWVLPSDGSVGIYGTFLATEASSMDVDSSADIVLGLTQNLKTGENKVNLLIKSGSSQIDALNNNQVLLSIPVAITVVD